MNTTISPKLDFWISVAFAVIAAIATGTVAMPDAIPATVQHDIKQWATFLVGMYTMVAPLFPGLSSAHTGPLVKSPPPPPHLTIVVLAACLLTLSPTIGHAKTAKPIPQHKVQSILDLSPDLLNNILLDLNSTITLANAQKDTVAVTCYSEIQTELTAIQQSQSGSNLPTPHLFYTFQTARGFANAVLPNSALTNACATLAQQVKMTMQDLIGGLITGSLGGAAIGPLFGF